MGMTTTSLHVWGIGKETLAAIRGNGMVLRDNNPPWIDLLVPDPELGQALEQLAKQLTKANPEAAALLFFYFDDELFTCSLYRDGKKTAGCQSQASWGRLGRALDAIFGDDLAGKAFRYAARCTDLDEQVRLIEESVGTALLDHPEFAPRTVPRSDACLRQIKAREAALRKRKNQYILTELPAEDWPVDWQAQLGLYERIRPEWRKNDASDLLFRFGDPRFSVPRHPELAFQRVRFGCGGDTARRSLLYSFPDGRLEDRPDPEFALFGPLWITKQGDTVFLASEYETVQTPVGPRRDYVKPKVVCLGADNSLRWQFIPAGAVLFPSAFHTAPDGTITLYSCGNSYISRDAFLCRINGETGALLASRVIPAAENLEKLLPVEALNSFVYFANRDEIVVLNENLTETARWASARSILGPDQKHIVGCVLWDQYFGDQILRLYDLRTGSCREIRPEIPVYVHALLPDGRFLGVNEVQNRLTVFDPTGRVISRHKALGDGAFTRVRAEEDRILILEIRAPHTHGYVSNELFEATSFHVWRLDPA